MAQPQKPTQNACLICIDGWGVSDPNNLKGDAIHHAKTPVMDSLKKEYPNVELSAHGTAVGLPEGLMGNSEVGHLNIGAGRVVYQDIVRIELGIKKDTLKKEKAIVKMFDRVKKGNGRLHLLGLVSDGGVHSHINHLFYLLKVAKEAGIPHTYVHCFGDGRDTAPRSAAGYIQQLKDYIAQLHYGTIATMTGRYFAMDRDKRWERVKVAFEGLTKGEGEKNSDVVGTINKRYEKDETDEFLKPIIVAEEGCIKDNDALFFFNFRADRMRQIVQTFGSGSADKAPFELSHFPKNLMIACMTQYKAEFPFEVASPPQVMDNVMAEWLAKLKVPQCHIAETEKYAHVTFFFNGGTEAQYEGEERSMIPSPKVATYDLQPHMSVAGVAEEVAKRIGTKKFPFVMCNFAPPDMVGHTGMFDPAVKGVEATDKAIGVIYEACKQHGYTLFITADHGNAEKMISEDGNPHTAHTCAKVPFIMTSKKFHFVKDTSEAALSEVAPTVLKVMGLSVPEEMTGKVIVE